MNNITKQQDYIF